MLHGVTSQKMMMLFSIYRYMENLLSCTILVWGVLVLVLVLLVQY
jgi:hypothetical protein